MATGSEWSHCGIIVFKNGHPYDLEASNHVKLTEVNGWIKRGKGGIYKKKRVLDDCPKIRYKKYLGMPYDLAFKFDNNKMYCSELVYVIYKDQLGIQLCEPRKVSTYNTLGLKKFMKKRNISFDQYVVAPSDLL